MPGIKRPYSWYIPVMDKPVYRGQKSHWYGKFSLLLHNQFTLPSPCLSMRFSPPDLGSTYSRFSRRALRILWMVAWFGGGVVLLNNPIMKSLTFQALTGFGFCAANVDHKCGSLVELVGGCVGWGLRVHGMFFARLTPCPHMAPWHVRASVNRGSLLRLWVVGD